MNVLNRFASWFSGKHPRAAAFIEMHATSLAFLFGFVWDNLTLSRVDAFYDNLVLFSYLIIAAGSIFLINIASQGRLTKLSRWLPPLAQFAFGGLFSSYIVYFSRTGVWWQSWPFLLMLVALVVGNELFKTRYQSFIFQTSILFVAVFSFLIFYLPVLTGMMGTIMFMLSGLLAAALTGGYVYAVYKTAPVRATQAARPLMGIVGGIFVTFHLLYFINAIPPLPLSLTDVGVYHSVEKVSGGYAVTFEPKEEAWWRKLIPFAHHTIHVLPGEPVYAFTSVFAPTRLSTPIYHKWERYDERNGEWQFMGRIGFPISGGRNEGYRGYSYKDVPPPGDWRLSVETERGALIGRIRFTIALEADAPELQTDIR